MKNSIALAFIIILTGCALMERHPELAKDVKAVEVELIDDAALEAKSIVQGPSGSTGL